MSELTKIAAILFRNLSDALLTTATELKQLDSAPPLSQTEETTNLVSSDTREFTKRENYKVGDRVMVNLKGSFNPSKMRILEIVSEADYLVYHQKISKKDSMLVTYDQILGLDPDR